MSTFKHALLAELTAEVERRATAVPKRKRWKVTAAAATGAAAALVAALAWPAATPAYAVDVNDDGTVSVTVNFFADPAEANRELREAGVRALILLTDPECRSDGGGPGPDTVGLQPIVRVEPGQVVVDPDEIAPGTLLVFGVTRNPDPDGVTMVSVRVRSEPAPTCLPPGGAGPSD
jgi:hypothetical protein